jgi:MFS family permease
MPHDTELVPEHRTRYAGMFRALGHRNFRIFWFGAFLSNTGTWMQAVAQGWLVLSLTNSPFWLGVDGFMATAPGLFFTLAGGVFADLVDRRKLLFATQIGAGLAALILAILVATGVVHVWMVLALSFLTGSCMALAGPSYQAITIDLAGREDLANAIALNSTQFQLARAVGPALAGAGFRLFGLAGCFFANALSFVAVVVGLSWLDLSKVEKAPPAHSLHDRRALVTDLVDGFRYVAGRPRVFTLLLICFVTNLFGAPFLTMMPYYAREVLHMGETGFAFLMGTSGAGAFFGALMLTFLGDFRRKGVILIAGIFIFAASLIGFSLSHNAHYSIPFIFVMGFSIVFGIALSNVLLQGLVTDEMRGRVMSMFILSFIGAMPIGNLLAGTASYRFGVEPTLAAGGVIIIVFITIVALTNPRLRALE